MEPPNDVLQILYVRKKFSLHISDKHSLLYIVLGNEMKNDNVFDYDDWSVLSFCETAESCAHKNYGA